MQLSCNAKKPYVHSGIILGMGSANERRRYIVANSRQCERYIVTPCLIDWAHTQNDPWYFKGYTVPMGVYMTRVDKR